MTDTKDKPTKDLGKNIRVPTKTWQSIRKYCVKHNITIGDFVVEATKEKLKEKK